MSNKYLEKIAEKKKESKNKILLGAGLAATGIYTGSVYSRAKILATSTGNLFKTKIPVSPLMKDIVKNDFKQILPKNNKINTTSSRKKDIYNDDERYRRWREGAV